MAGEDDDELERITSRLKEHEREIADLQASGDPGEQDRLAHLERSRLALIARLRGLGESATNGDA